jgi:hypothetical protein
MTAKPVPEHISDERLEDLEAWALAEEIEATEDDLPLTTQRFSDIACALTELQHRREAEAGTREAFIKRMVDRFLGWKLPENFSPDGGISFEKIGNAGTTYEYTREPIGTNLLDAVQATAMVRYMVNGVDGDPLQPVIDRLIEIEKTTGAVPMAASPSSPASGVRVSEEQQEKEAAFVAAGGAKRVDGHYSNADTGVVGTVPTEVYLSYEAQAKEIAARSETETQTAIKNSILLFVLKARMAENEQCAALIEDRGKNNVGRVHPVDAGHAAAIRSRLSALGEHP